MMEDVDPESLAQHRDDGAGHHLYQGDEEIAARATVPSPTPDKIESCPHAALALAMASTVGATWGSGSQVLSISGDSTTEAPEEEGTNLYILPGICVNLSLSFTPIRTCKPSRR